jgi:DNA (cytosine-5)-methyltransferase 1
MAFNPQTGGSGARIGYGETATALQASQITGVQVATAVRRLTPRETERLQDFPDDWTRWKLVDGELVEQSDSARYRQVGNAVTVAVPRWIIARIVALEARAERAA